MTNPNPTLEYHLPTGEELETAKEYVSLGYKAVPVNDLVLNALNFAEKCLPVLEAVNDIAELAEMRVDLMVTPVTRKEYNARVRALRALVAADRGVEV